MTERSRRWQAAAAGLGAAFVELWPVLVIARAGASGSVGDLSEVRILGVAIAYAVPLGAVVAWLMYAALRRAASSPGLGSLDPWGAYALGVGVYVVTTTALPALMWGLFLADEDQSLRSREWLVSLLWIGGHLACLPLAVGAGRLLLGRRLRPADDRGLAHGGTSGPGW